MVLLVLAMPMTLMLTLTPETRRQMWYDKMKRRRAALRKTVSSRSSSVMALALASVAVAAQASTYPFEAAIRCVSSSHGAPFSRAHLSSSMWPPSAAA